jgi:hypothetical protein
MRILARRADRLIDGLEADGTRRTACCDLPFVGRLEASRETISALGGHASALTGTDPLVLMETDPVIAHEFAIDRRDQPKLRGL